MELCNELLKEIINDEEQYNKQFNDIMVTLNKFVIGYMYEDKNESFLNEAKSQLDVGEKQLIEDCISINKLSLEEIKDAIREYGLPLGINFGESLKSDIYNLIDEIEKIIDLKLNTILFGYSREELLIYISIIASILSKNTLSVYADEVKEEIILDEVNLLGESLRLLNEIETEDMRIYFGDLKNTVELFINTILLNKHSSLNYFTKKSINYTKILSLFHAKLLFFEFRKGIELVVRENKKEIEISYEKGIVLPEEISKSFSDYTRDTKKSVVIVENTSTGELFDKFQKEFEYKPTDMLRYLEMLHAKSKVPLHTCLILYYERRFIINDIIEKIGLSEKGANNMLDGFILNNHEFYEIDETIFSAKEYIHSNNNRLFRTPIIQCKESLMIPSYAWMESAVKLSLRILKREYLFKNDIKNWNEDIKNLFDEFYINSIQKKLTSVYSNVFVNYDLGKSSNFKKILNGKKDLPHELDVVYFDDVSKTLVIKDLKNLPMQHEISGVVKNRDSIKSYKKKLRNFEKFIKNNKSIFEKEFNNKFENISLGLITVNLTSYNYFNKEDSISVTSLHDYLENPRKYV